MSIIRQIPSIVAGFHKIVAIDEESGEIGTFKRNERTFEYVYEESKDVAINNARHSRFQLQNVAVKILSTVKTPKFKPWRIVKCTRHIVGSEVGVLLSNESQRANFSGLETCSSVWVCPCCSAKVSERRRQEIVAATDLHKSVGGGLYLVTMTWAHHRHDDLSLMIKSSRSALVRLRKQTAYKRILKSIGYLGMIRAFEVTYGDSNGWHPHFHELFFTNRPLTRIQLRSWQSNLYAEWRKQCLKFGLGEPNRTFGITIIKAESAAEYIAKFGNAPKWGVASELTKVQTKKGRKSSITPWEMLRLYDEGQHRYAYLFCDYANAFFGARQIFWTPLLKASFGFDELTDEEVANKQDDDVTLVCRISFDDWKKVINRYDDYRSVILCLAESHHESAISDFLKNLQ